MAKETWKTKARNSKYMTHELLRAIEAAHDKLAKYYNKTGGDTSAFYNLGARSKHKSYLFLNYWRASIRRASRFLRPKPDVNRI